MDVEKTIAFILEQRTHVAVIHARMEERAARDEAEIARLDKRLRRSIRLAVEEARNERRRRSEGDQLLARAMADLATAQARTEQTVDRLGQKIDRFVESLGHPRANGDEP